MPPKGFRRIGWYSVGTKSKRAGQRVSNEYAERYPHLVNPVWKKIIPPDEKEIARKLASEYFDKTAFQSNFKQLTIAKVKGEKNAYVIEYDFTGKRKKGAKKKYTTKSIYVNTSTGVVSSRKD